MKVDKVSTSQFNLSTKRNIIAVTDKNWCLYVFGEN